MAIPLLPFLDPAPYQAPLVDPKTGQMTDAWRRWHINLERTISGQWADVPYSASNYTTNDAGITWSVSIVQQVQLTYFQMGPYAVVSFYLNGGTVSADVPTLEITIPTLQVTASANYYPSACLVKDGAAATELGLAYVIGTTTSQAIIAIQKATNLNFLLASASIQCYGHVVFRCQSYVTP